MASPKRNTLREMSVISKPASSDTTSIVVGTAVTWKGTLKDRLVTSPEEVKVFVAAAPVTGEPFTFKRTVSVAGIEVPVFTEAVPWKVA